MIGYMKFDVRSSFMKMWQRVIDNGNTIRLEVDMNGKTIYRDINKAHIVDVRRDIADDDCPTELVVHDGTRKHKCHILHVGQLDSSYGLQTHQDVLEYVSAMLNTTAGNTVTPTTPTTPTTSVGALDSKSFVLRNSNAGSVKFTAAELGSMAWKTLCVENQSNYLPAECPSNKAILVKVETVQGGVGEVRVEPGAKSVNFDIETIVCVEVCVIADATADLLADADGKLDDADFNLHTSNIEPVIGQLILATD